MELEWESLSSRRRKHKLVMFYKMINGLCPDYLAEMEPERVSQISSYNLRNSDDYLTTRTSSQIYFNFFYLLLLGNGMLCLRPAEMLYL